MEKYGFTYSNDLDLVQKILEHVTVEELGDGVVKVCEGSREYHVRVRDWSPPKEPLPEDASDEQKLERMGVKTIEAAPERKGKAISVWDAWKY